MPEAGTSQIGYTSLDDTRNSYHQQQKVLDLLKQNPSSDTFSRDSLQLVDQRGTVVTTDWTTPTTYTPKLIEQLGREYQDGMSSIGLAKKHGLDARTIRKHLRRAGIEIRKGPTSKESKHAMHLRDTGMTYAAIGEQLGYSTSTIQRCIRRNQLNP